jgi:P27 family predicted phage terminase small subunit
MPTNVIAFDKDKMQVGKKGGGRHWTKAEVEARGKAAEKINRKTKVNLVMPNWLGIDAKKIWDKTIKEMQGLNILDNVDAEALAIYCDAVFRYQDATKKIASTGGYVTTNAQGTETVNPHVKAAQSYSRIIIQYAGKLGITADSRARLTKKIGDSGGKKTAAERKKEQMFGR